MLGKRDVFSMRSHHKLQDSLTAQCKEQAEYIARLEELLNEHEIQLPPKPQHVSLTNKAPQSRQNQLENASEAEIRRLVEHLRQYMRPMDIALEYTHLSYTVRVPRTREISSVSSLLRSVLFFWRACEEKQDVRILSDVTGRIKPRKMTLLIGPPGSGKSVLMKTLVDRLRPESGSTLEGDVFYQGDSIRSGKFIPAKVASYTEQGDTLDAVLTVQETLQFAWLATSGGHLSYAHAKDEESAAALDAADKGMVFVSNFITGLGLDSCKDMYVGNSMIRGVSGGQKRRVTVGEMAVCSRPVALMDCISNGLDSATAFDLVRAIRLVNQIMGTTVLVSLLQPSPDLFDLFDEVIVLSEGQVVYHGPRDEVVQYFSSLGYHCPDLVDVADFLQELPTPDGERFLVNRAQRHDTETLAKCWKDSELFQRLLSDMHCEEYSKKEATMGSIYPRGDMEAASVKVAPHNWYPDQNEPYPASFSYYLGLQLRRQWKVVVRDAVFVRSRIGQSLIIGAVAGSLFNNIGTEDVNTLNGFLFGAVLFGALGNFSILPIVFEQKKVFYKQTDALFFPTSAFTLAQSICLFPLTLLEQILYITIVYWTAGLSPTENGSRFLSFLVLSLACVMCIGQMFRLIGAVVPEQRLALPFAGLVAVIMILFSGFIQPKALIPKGWQWFYWLNPIAWTLKGVSVNELSAPRYDFLTCTDPLCTHTQRFGDFVLSQFGNPTDLRFVWYSFAVMVAEYIFLFVLTFLALKYLRTESHPPPPVRPDTERETTEKGKETSGHYAPSGVVSTAEETERDAEHGTTHTVHTQEQEESDTYARTQLPFEQVSLAFKDIWYTVTLSSGEDVDLLKGIDGYFEPGTMTALMGSTGAGKTTLLDVLAGRKNTGTLKGQVFVNGMPKVDHHFRKIMAYVEQFDTLSQKSTAREAIAFSAALRLAPTITREQRKNWVGAVLKMLELDNIADELIGDMDAGGMTFEQRKRVSIGVELAANPSILFLDEPTTGLDSRAAQALMRTIRRIASSGRTIVCTIHQPSTAIFSAFDSLLLLRRGGQTVYFGDLGERCETLVGYFESVPHTQKLAPNVNPAAWMLEVVGAGTGSTANDVDHCAFYLQSNLCASNANRLAVFMQPMESSSNQDTHATEDSEGYCASSWRQFQLLFKRISLTYWRTPSYSFGRLVVNIFIALIFASAYPLYKYKDYVAVMSRVAVIYVTTMFCGILALITMIPVSFADRDVFYREQQSRMYRTWIYAIVTFLIEIPYVLLTSLVFTLPFFFIVGFDNVGNVTHRFFWYWLFSFLFQLTMVNFGQLFAAVSPNEVTSLVLSGLTTTILGYFCGFLIAEQSFPTFWLFMYWLNPMHYALEGLVATMAYGDDTPIALMNGAIVSAEYYTTQIAFTTWKYKHAGFDVLALALFIFLALVGKYLCLAFFRHDKR